MPEVSEYVGLAEQVDSEWQILLPFPMPQQRVAHGCWGRWGLGAWIHGSLCSAMALNDHSYLFETLVISKALLIRMLC